MIAQTLIAGGVVLAAAAWLVVRQLRRGKSEVPACSGCIAKSPSGGSCPSCPSGQR